MRNKSPPAKRKTHRRREYTVHGIKTYCSTKMLNEVKRLQKSTDLLIPKLPFCRLVQEIIQQQTRLGIHLRVQGNAIEALQEAAELYLVEMFAESCKCAAHAKRVTVLPKDVRLLLDLRGPKDPAFDV